MEIIGRISKGSKMDQVYLPKQRQGMPVGSHVLVSPLETKKEEFKPFFHNVPSIELLKLGIILEIFTTLRKTISCENILITGSFLDKGFQFNDIDVLVIADNNTPLSMAKKKLEDALHATIQLIAIDMKTLIQGLATDPLYEMMVSRFVSMKRVLFKKAERRIMPEHLDLNLLKSQTLLFSFDVLSGYLKYKLTRNMVAIADFLDGKKLSAEAVDAHIRKIFGLSSANLIKENLLDKQDFVKKYKQFYKKTFDKIMEHLMSRNRNSDMDHLVGNLATAVMHGVLEKTTTQEEIAKRYRKEVETSMHAARAYRKKINPKHNYLPAVDSEYIRGKVFDRAMSELRKRIAKGYAHVNLNLVESMVDEALADLQIRK